MCIYVNFIKNQFSKTAMAAVAAAGVMTGVAGTVIGSKAFDGALKYENTRESRQKLTDEISKSNPELAYRLTLDDLKNTLDDYTYMALFGTPPNDKEAQIENDLREAQKKSQALVTAGLALALLGGAGYGHISSQAGKTNKESEIE